MNMFRDREEEEKKKGKKKKKKTIIIIIIIFKVSQPLEYRHMSFSFSGIILIYYGNIKHL